jgi:hypothetical protein
MKDECGVISRAYDRVSMFGVRNMQRISVQTGSITTPFFHLRSIPSSRYNLLFFKNPPNPIPHNGLKSRDNRIGIGRARTRSGDPTRSLLCPLPPGTPSVSHSPTLTAAIRTPYHSLSLHVSGQTRSIFHFLLPLPPHPT